MSNSSKAIPETIIDRYVEVLKIFSPDDAKALVIEEFEKQCSEAPIPTMKLAGFVASLFGGLIGLGLNYDQACEVFLVAVSNIQSQEQVFRAMERNLKDMRGTTSKQ